jgi:hypothetical protein
MLPPSPSVMMSAVVTAGFGDLGRLHDPQPAYVLRVILAFVCRITAATSEGRQARLEGVARR